MGEVEALAMDAQDREIYTKLTDAVLRLSAGIVTFETAVEGLITAVNNLTHTVDRLEMRTHDQPAE